MSLLLNATWLIPAATVILLMLIPRDKVAAIRGLSLTSASTTAVLVIGLLAHYLLTAPSIGAGATATELAYSSRATWFEVGGVPIEFFTGVDAISLLMMTMAGVISVCGILVSWSISDRAKEFHILLATLLAGTYGCFISFDLFTFFLFNEITLIPTYLLIAMFGSGKREFAAMKLNLMLFGGSALIILGLAAVWAIGGTFDLITLADQGLIPRGAQMWLFPAMFGGFAILGSVFPFHTWSPVGHASAPTAISMFLAGVHMKLGGYGCLRAAIYVLPEGAIAWADVFLVLATISVIYGAIIAIRQTDLKYINAYSSISHVGLVTVGFVALSTLGLRGGILQMLSHGFVTALVFALIGSIYGRTHTREVGEMGGLMQKIPFLAIAFVLAGFAVVGIPGSSSFVAELNIFIGAFAAGAGGPLDAFRATCAVLCVLSIVVTAVYVLRTVNRVAHGEVKLPDNTEDFGDATGIEGIAVLILLVCIVGMGLMPGWIIERVDDSLVPIINTLANAGGAQ